MNKMIRKGDFRVLDCFKLEDGMERGKNSMREICPNTRVLIQAGDGECLNLIGIWKLVGSRGKHIGKIFKK